MPVSPQTFGQFIHAKAEQSPDTIVLRFVHFDQPDEIVTYSMLAINGHKLAVALQRQGLTRGMTFGVMLRNHPEFVYALVAASLLGAIVVPIDVRRRGEALRRQLAHAECRALLVADYALPHVRPILAQLPGLLMLQVLHTGEDNAHQVPSDVPLLNACFAGGPDVFLPSMVVDPAQALEILYTSGTTGVPKGVVIDNERLLGFRALGKWIFGYQSDDRLYTGLSLAHGNAQAVTLMGALGQGIEAVMTRQFSKSRLWDITRTYGITTFALLGGMATALYSEPVRASDGENPVRLVTSAGMPASLWEGFEQRFNVRILEWYGAVEGGFVYKPIGEGPVGSCGRLSPGYDLRVVDANDQECPPGVVGELLFRPHGGPAQFAYWQDYVATAHKVRHGWLHSGDMVHRDAAGYVFFHYRQGEAIRRNGEFIHSGDVAKVLTEHPEIADVFVYGVPARSGAPGEQDLVAAVVPSHPGHFDAIQVFAACRQHVPANAVPSYLQLVPEIPKTLSEKPQKHVLLAAFEPTGLNVFEAPDLRAPLSPAC